VHSYTTIKICGITNADDAEFTAASGADFIGVVMHPGSVRCCPVENIETIQNVINKTPSVLVFGDDPPEYALGLFNRFDNGSTYIQYPVRSTNFAQIAESVNSEKLIPSIAIDESISEKKIDEYKSYAWVVFDTGGKKDSQGRVLDGGTGVAFDWNAIKEVRRPYLLAGGIKKENIKEAIEQINPPGFDISGGVEKSPGIKDHELIKNIIDIIR